MVTTRRRSTLIAANFNTPPARWAKYPFRARSARAPPHYFSSFAHLKIASLAGRVRVVKVFFRWLHEETLLRNPAVKLKEPRLPHRILKALSAEAVELLRSACESLLEHALVESFFVTGCRVGEIHGLDQDKLDWTRRSAIVLGKGSKEREVCFGAKAALWLRRYLNS